MDRLLYLLTLSTISLSCIIVQQLDAVDRSEPMLIDPPKMQVIGGIDTDILEMPFAGALVWNEEYDNSNIFCSCTAIDPYWVLTAAHCVDDLDDLFDFKLVFGTNDLGTFSSSNVYYPQTVVLHPNYSLLYSDSYSDIALIQLSTPLPSWITPIELNASPDNESSGLKATIAGWGRTSLESNETPEILQSAEVDLINLEDSNMPDIYKSRVNGTMIAAGRNNPYTSGYHGDSGGPLMIFEEESETWVQVGVSNTGSGNEGIDSTGYYARVSSFKDWIDQIVQNDFHHWLGKWDVSSLQFDDGDDYSPALEWMLDLDPTGPDSLDWSLGIKQSTKNDARNLVFPLQFRNHIPRNFLNLQKSDNLIEWETTEFPLVEWTTHPSDDPYLSLFEVPLIDSDSQEAFYRLKLNDQKGIYRGPIPLRIGTEIFGTLGKAYNNTGLNSEGPNCYDFILDTLGVTLPIEIFVNFFALDYYKITVYDLQNGSVKEAFIHSYAYELFEAEFSPEPDRQYLIRVEVQNGYYPMQFQIATDFKTVSPIYSPGTVITGSLTHDDIPYIRPGYYSDRYQFACDVNTLYKITISSSTLDTVIITKRKSNKLMLEEVDEESPGVSEEFLYFSDNNSILEVFSGSWRFEETGDYTLKLERHSEPSEVSPGDNYLGIVDPLDRKYTSNNTTYSYDYYTITGVEETTGMTIVLDGLENNPVAMVVYDTTEDETIHQSSVSENRLDYFFLPEENHNYNLIIIGIDEFLYKNFRITTYAGDTR